MKVEGATVGIGAGDGSGRFVLVYPSVNPSFTRAAAAYRSVLRDPTTFESRVMEDILAAPDALDGTTVDAMRDRYSGSALRTRRSFL